MQNNLPDNDSPVSVSRWPVILLAAIAIAIPFIAQSQKANVAARGELPLISGGMSFPPSPLRFEAISIGPAPDSAAPPRITNVKIVDFDQDGMTDIIACDTRLSRVVLHRQRAANQWEEKVLGEDIVAPAHATPVDIDGDDDLDVLVAVLGDIWPNDEHVGKLVLLENQGGSFVRHILLDDVRRVADVQAGDLDGDGDLDLAVAVFGYAHGQILWLENMGEFKFRDRELLSAPGTIHVPLADYDDDGDLDIVGVVSQNEEEVWALENQGDGTFIKRLLFMTFNYDIGSAGLVVTDLDGDADPDLLLPVGDNLEDVFSYPQPYHGCIWLENQGGWRFESHRISDLGGAYAVAAGDMDADGDQDVALVSMLNDWEQPDNASLIWLENDGRQQFKQWQIASEPTHLVTVACGDLNGDGRADIVAGGLHLHPPFDRLGGVSTWISRGAAR